MENLSASSNLGGFWLLVRNKPHQTEIQRDSSLRTRTAGREALFEGKISAAGIIKIPAGNLAMPTK